ncbi:MAG: hemerythrin domain-containing protein [Myxococcota bacterium]
MPISRLLSIHERLERHFAQHQELLLNRELDQARLVLVGYTRLIQLHMQHEEERLLPIYLRVEPPRRFPPQLFTGQHQRMRELLEGVNARLSALPRERDRLQARAIIELLDYERTYKHLVEHHDGAEQQAFFPALDRLASAAEQSSIAEECLHEWNRLESELALMSVSTAHST